MNLGRLAVRGLVWAVTTIIAPVLQDKGAEIISDAVERRRRKKADQHIDDIKGD